MQDAVHPPNSGLLPWLCTRTEQCKLTSSHCSVLVQYRNCSCCHDTTWIMSSVYSAPLILCVMCYVCIHCKYIHNVCAVPSMRVRHNSALQSCVRHSAFPCIVNIFAICVPGQCNTCQGEWSSASSWVVQPSTFSLCDHSVIFFLHGHM